MKFFRWIVKYIRSLLGVKEKLPKTETAQEIVVSETSKRKGKSLKKVDYTSKQVDDLPEEDEIENNVVYIVGENGYRWLAAFRCPCGCEKLVQLNLLPEAKPCWKVSYNKYGDISIIPSIDRKTGCKSHFTLINGIINWWQNGDNLF